MSNGRVEVGIGRGVYGREASNLNKDADLKDQAKNFRLFAETVELMKKAWTQDFISHQGEFYHLLGARIDLEPSGQSEI